MNNNLLSKEDVLLNSLYIFYKNKENINKLLPIITGKSKISLRVLDYFVTNYSKKNDITIIESDKIYNIHQDYKNTLKSYNKRFFDPFCRNNKKNLTNKIAFKYDDNNVVITTIGQLNFFKWAIKNNIINYVLNDYILINNDMNNNLRNKKNKKISTKELDNKKVLNTTIFFNNNTKFKFNTMNLSNNEIEISKIQFEK